MGPRPTRSDAQPLSRARHAEPFSVRGPAPRRKDEWDKVLYKFVARTYTPKLADAHKEQFAAVSSQRTQPPSTRSRPETTERSFIVREGFFLALFHRSTAPSFAEFTFSMAVDSGIGPAARRRAVSVRR